MVERTPEEEKLYQETRKTKLECAALERAAKTEPLKIVLTFLAAFTFVLSFALDRYSVSEQRYHDRRVEVATEFDALLSNTLAAITQARPNTLFFRLNVQAYRGKLEELRVQTEHSSDRDELSLFITESIGFVDRFLKSQPQKFEFEQWTSAIDAEAVWAGRDTGFTPDFNALFGNDLASHWQDLRTKALTILRNKFSLFGDTEPVELTEFRAAATRFQAGLQNALR